MDFNSEASTPDSSPLAERLEKQGLADNENSNDDGDESSRDRQQSSSPTTEMTSVKIDRDHQMKYLKQLLCRLESFGPGAERVKSSLRKMARKVLGRTKFPEGKEIHPFFYYHETKKVLSISFLCDNSKISPWPAILDMHFGPDIIKASQRIYDIITDEDTSTDMQLSLSVSSDGKRKRGRPRKETLNGGSLSYMRANEGVKRKRGRPPKTAIGSEYLKLRRPTGLGKRKRGRPRKTDMERAPGEDASKFFITGPNAGPSVGVKRGPGRPPKCRQIPQIPGVVASDFFSNSRDEFDEGEQSDEPANDPYDMDFDDDDMDNETSHSSKSRKTTNAAPGIDAQKFFVASKSSESKSSEKRGRGRPKKSTGENSTPKPKPSLPIPGSSEKRGRGRPRKSVVNGSSSTTNNSSEAPPYLNSDKTTELKESDISPPIKSNPPTDFGQVSTEDSETPGTIKRGRGRPRKNPPTPAENNDQTLTARPQSNSSTEDAEKRKRGRPRKSIDENASMNGDSTSDILDPNEVEEDEPSPKRQPSPPPESSSLTEPIVTKKEESIDEFSTSAPLVTDPQQTTIAVRVVEPNPEADMDCPSSEIVKEEEEELIGPSLIEMTRSMTDLQAQLNEADRIALQEIGVESH
ncbi:uncharacterized protein LOC141853201 isoform X2 [Brevipalpus obovatus]